MELMWHAGCLRAPQSQPLSQPQSQHLSRRLLLLSLVLLRFNSVVAWAGRDPLFV